VGLQMLEGRGIVELGVRPIRKYFEHRIMNAQAAALAYLVLLSEKRPWHALCNPIPTCSPTGAVALSSFDMLLLPQ
jgi:hypothetical protein